MKKNARAAIAAVSQKELPLKPLESPLTKLEESLIRAYIEKQRDQWQRFKSFYLFNESHINRKGEYCYISSYEGIIVEIISDILRTFTHEELPKKSFVDIGAGRTTIPDLMSKLGFKEAHGLEKNPVYLALSPFLIAGDLLDYNFKKYDVLYAYHPIAKEETMIEGINNIVSTMKEGAIFYFCIANGTKLGNHLIKLGAYPCNKNTGILKYVKPYKISKNVL